jgi:hypothetical protein
MDPELIEQLNEQLREMSDILSQQNRLMAEQVRNMNNIAREHKTFSGSLKNNTDATNNNTKSFRDLSEEQDRLTTSTSKLGRGLEFVASSIMTFGKTVMDSNHNFQKYGNVVDTVSGTIADLGKEFGVVGQVLGGIVKTGGELLKYQFNQVDSLLKFNDTVSKLGAMNQFSSQQILEMANKAGFAAKDLDKLSGPIEKLGSNFKMLGNNASDSVKKFMEMAAVGSDTRQEFQRLGYSQTELVEAQADYIRSMGEIGLSLRLFGNDVKTLQKASLEYIKNLQVMAEISGLTVEEQVKRRERVAATFQAQMYILEMGEKIQNAKTEKEKSDLSLQLQNTIDTAGIIAKLFGEDAALGFMQEAYGVPQTLGLDQTSLQNVSDDIKRAAKLAREGKLDQQTITELQNQLLNQKIATLNGPLGQASMFSPEIQKLLGGMEAIFEVNRLRGYDPEIAKQKIQEGIEKNKEEEGPAATDEYQIARNKLTEAEIKLRQEFEKFANEINLVVPAIEAMTEAANLAATTLENITKNTTPNNYGSEIFASIMAAAGLGLGGLATWSLFKNLQIMNVLSRNVATSPGNLGSTFSPVNNLPKTPDVLNEGGTRYVKTAGGVFMPESQIGSVTSPDSVTAKTKTSRFGKFGEMLSNAGNKLSKFGISRLAGGAGSILGGLALSYGADAAEQAGYTKTSGALSTGSYALTGAGTGAMFGGPVGALIGGLIGGGIGLYQNWDKITGKKIITKQTPEIKSNDKTSNQHFSRSVNEHFSRSVNDFGKIIASFGKIVSSYVTATKGFIKAAKSIENSASHLSKLGANASVNNKNNTDTKNLSYITNFGKSVTYFGKIVSSYVTATKGFIKAAKSIENSASHLSKLSANASVNNKNNTDTKYITNFGKSVTYFGKIVSSYVTATKGFIKAAKSIENLASHLSKLSANASVNNKNNTDTKYITNFGKFVTYFGRMVESFGRIVSSFNKSTAFNKNSVNSLTQSINSLEEVIKPKNKKLLSTFSDEEEQETLIEYIEKLKNSFKETTKANEEMLDQEIKRHNFNELSFKNLRISLDEITKKFDNLAKLSLFGSTTDIYDTEGDFSGLGADGAGSTENAAKAMKFFMDKGWSREQAAGIVGNLQQESGPNLNPRAVNKNDAGPGLHSYGIAQWNKERFENLKRFAKERGTSWDDFYTQMEFVHYELTQGEKKRVGEKLRKIKDAAEAAVLIDKKYEVSTGEHRNKRIANAVRLAKNNDAQLADSRNDYSTSTITESNRIAELGKYLERTYGVKVSEHSVFTPDGKKITSGHSKNSKHYKDLAIDVNAPGGIKEWNDENWKRIFDHIAADVKSRGFKVIWGDKGHKDHMHIESPIKAAQGGIFSGPSSGYPAELHGSEMVAPLDTNSILMKLATTPSSTTTNDITTTTSTIEKEIIEKISNTNQETLQILIDKLDDLIDAVEQGNDVRDKMYKSNMI